MSTPSKGDFERTFQIAEYARQSGENRRQYEFKVFISYVTMLILAIYEGHHIIPSDENHSVYGILILFLLSMMHFFYLAWTISLSVANQNDGTRRNFYLDKAECISHSHLMEFGDQLSRKLKGEYQCGPNEKIIRVPRFYEVGNHIDQLWINYAAALQAAIPTILFFLLVFNLFKSYTGWWRVGVVGISLLPFLMCLALRCKKKDKHNERHQTP